MVKKIGHGIAVKDLAAAIKFYEEMLGLKATGTEVMEEQKVRVAFCRRGTAK